MPLDPAKLGLFLAAAVALLLTPGPVVLYVVARSMSQGPRAGLASVLGAEIGNGVHVLAAALGLAALMTSAPLAFAAVKVLGAAYLIYLAARRLAARREASPLQPAERSPAALRAAFGQGVLVAVLNPKTALFFLAFLPPFVDPARGSPTAQILLLGALFVGLAMVSDGAYALLAGRLGRWLWSHPRLLERERFLSAALYLGLGLLAALSGPGFAGARR